jgi:two-component system, NtrC family, sensor kinase
MAEYVYELVLPATRAIVMAVAVVYLWRAGRDRYLRRQGGWGFIVSGFSLLLFGLLLEVAGGLPRPILSLPAGWEFFLESVVGYLLGMILMVTGFLKWIPSVRALAEAREKLEKDGDGLEKAIAERTAHLAELNLRLERELAERKTVEKELVRLSGALAGLADMVIITDLGHRIIYANAAAEKILGYSPSEMIGRDSREFFEGIPGNPRQLGEKMAKEAVGGTWKGELLNRRKDGRMIDAHLTITVLPGEDGRKAGFVGITRDITEKKREAEKLARAYREMRDLKGQLIQAEKLSSLGLLAAGVAHELNSPLDGLMTLLRLSRNKAGPNSPEGARLETMLTAAEHMAKIVGDLSAFARRSREHFQELDLNDVIESTLSFSGCHLKERAINVSKNFDRRLEKVRGDRGQLQQVILNLITNARDAMGQGGRLEIRTENSPDRRAVMLTVSDNGHGIDPGHLGRLFDPFFTTKQPGEGIGLGLSVVYGIIESHRGEIHVESEPGGGAVFTIRLPAADGAKDDRPEDTAG